MNSWAHGYNIEVPYTFGYYKETNPLWIKWGVFLGGKKLPFENHLRILELGCGQGFNLCIHAGCFPKMEFLGIDFNPSHIAHAKELAKKASLKNIRFEEGDFVELAENFPKDWGQFHIVILHGIWSWISKDVREKVIEILKNVVLPGGIVYNSYNAMPGWMTGTILREILRSYYKISNLPAIQALEKGLELAQKLKEVNAMVFNVYPNLKHRIEMASKHNKNYVVHEYINEAHTIFWVQEVIEEMLQAKLYYAGSANLVENFLPRLLPDPMENLVNQYSHPVFRLFLIDLMINQSFRRDLYQKGLVTPLGIEHIKEIRNIKFIKIEEPPEELKFQTSAGVIHGKKEIYIPILEALSNKPKSVEELLNLPELKKQNIGLPGIIQALTLLLNQGSISFYNEQYDASYTFKLNKTITKLCAEGRPYNFIASPVAGIGIMMSPIEMYILDTIFEGIIRVEDLVNKVELKLKILGKKVIKDGKPIENPEEAKKFLKQQIQEFIMKKISKLRNYKIIE